MFEDGKLFFNQAIEEKGSIADAFDIPRNQVLGNIKPLSVVNTNKEFNELFGTTPQQQLPVPSRESLTPEDLNNLTIDQLRRL